MCGRCISQEQKVQAAKARSAERIGELEDVDEKSAPVVQGKAELDAVQREMRAERERMSVELAERERAIRDEVEQRLRKQQEEAAARADALLKRLEEAERKAEAVPKEDQKEKKDKKDKKDKEKKPDKKDKETDKNEEINADKAEVKEGKKEEPAKKDEVTTEVTEVKKEEAKKEEAKRDEAKEDEVKRDEVKREEKVKEVKNEELAKKEDPTKTDNKTDVLSATLPAPSAAVSNEQNRLSLSMDPTQLESLQHHESAIHSFTDVSDVSSIKNGPVSDLGQSHLLASASTDAGVPAAISADLSRRLDQPKPKGAPKVVTDAHGGQTLECKVPVPGINMLGARFQHDKAEIVEMRTTEFAHINQGLNDFLVQSNVDLKQFKDVAEAKSVIAGITALCDKEHAQMRQQIVNEIEAGMATGKLYKPDAQIQKELSEALSLPLPSPLPSPTPPLPSARPSLPRARTQVAHHPLPSFQPRISRPRTLFLRIGADSVPH